MRQTVAGDDQRGFGALELLPAIGVVAVIVILGIVILTGGTAGRFQPTAPKQPQPTPTTGPAATRTITWTQTADGYTASGILPYCPDRIVQQFPADLTQVTAILYPGQVRGGEYKTDGGLRFDTAANNAVVVRAPFDGSVIGGAAYLAPTGDVQYSFDVMNDCGIMYRLNHLLTLGPKLADVAKAFPPPAAGSPAMTQVSSTFIKAGSLLATAVGTAADRNAYLEWGLYDWRTPNLISADTTWQKDPRHTSPAARHGICWLDQLPTDDQIATVKGLPPGDPAAGKLSDYCK